MRKFVAKVAFGISGFILVVLVDAGIKLLFPIIDIDPELHKLYGFLIWFVALLILVGWAWFFDVVILRREFNIRHWWFPKDDD